MTMMTAIRSAESEAAKSAGDKLAEARHLLPADNGLAAFFDTPRQSQGVGALGRAGKDFSHLCE